MTYFIILLFSFWLLYLIHEAYSCNAARNKLRHVVHVNGTRGKSSTSRMIEAGLRAGGYKVYCKTTGTDPMTIDVDGKEEPIKRLGKANIKEQIRIMKKAASQGAEILVVECMAITPEYQYAAQHKILKADIGVITNVRRDHTDVMGETIEEICTSLCSTVPVDGVLFTAENKENVVNLMKEKAESLKSSFRNPRPVGNEPEFDFAENIALALDVCMALGVDRETALKGMEAYKRDPYVLEVLDYKGTICINGLSINDIDSICMIWDKMENRFGKTMDGDSKRQIILVNNRGDRGSRTEDMMQSVVRLGPSEVWLFGSNQTYMEKHILDKRPGTVIRHLKKAEELTSLMGMCGSDDIIYAIGNLANEGRSITEFFRKEGTKLV